MLDLHPPNCRQWKLAKSYTAKTLHSTARLGRLAASGPRSFRLLDLPSEIVDEVVQNLSFSDLKNLQVTSSGLRRHATRALWAHVDINASVGLDPGVRPQMAPYLGSDCQSVCFPSSLECHHNCRRGYVPVNTFNIEALWKTSVTGQGPHGMPFNYVQCLSFYLDDTSPILLGQLNNPAGGSGGNGASPDLLFKWFLLQVVPRYFTNVKVVEINTGYRCVSVDILQAVVSYASTVFPGAALNVEAWIPNGPTSHCDLDIITPTSKNLRLFFGTDPSHKKTLANILTRPLPSGTESLFLHINSDIEVPRWVLINFFKNCSNLKVLSIKGILCEEMDWIPQCVEKLCIDCNDNGCVSSPKYHTPSVTLLPSVTYLRIINASNIPIFPLQLPNVTKFVISGKGDQSSLEVVCQTVLKHAKNVQQLTCRGIPYAAITNLALRCPGLTSMVAESDGSDPENAIQLVATLEGLHFLYLDLKAFVNMGGDALSLMKLILQNSPQMETLLIDHQCALLPRLRRAKEPINDGYSRVLLLNKAFSLDVPKFRSYYF
uniref:ARAD1D37444p n=1 Tax=Blastobotrys adeninivorans TaxID=409370 RepID=A0A060TC76_BLAAD